MNRVTTGAPGNFDKRISAQIALRRWRGTDRIRFISEKNVRRSNVRLGVNRDGRNTELAARPNDAHRNLTPIGNKNFLNLLLPVPQSSSLPVPS
jgi:hypothetical protein